ncbi:putative gap junction epsilon-1 protein isoform X2 [Sphaerodactylus townsendi]|uniref:putative gap junction epsilon-1 protein isoform X2 n=1 Tax=Sphaerodactylus townsendi TaxID=933632 RepID=UPI002026FB14|nr:putative gap junction epsilon-1 protein isoform X2 [Sphaerodactylus townsendi]
MQVGICSPDRIAIPQENFLQDMSLNYIKNFYEGCLRPPTVIGQFHTLFFGSVRMFFLGVLGFAVYGNEALHFSCEPDRREVNLLCYNQFRPITPQDHP